MRYYINLVFETFLAKEHYDYIIVMVEHEYQWEKICSQHLFLNKNIKLCTKHNCSS